MIIEAFFNAIVFILLGIIKLFPTIPTIRTDGLDGIFETLGLANTFVSLSTVTACLVVIFILNNANLVWSVIMWVVRKIPGVE